MPVPYVLYLKLCTMACVRRIQFKDRAKDERHHGGIHVFLIKQIFCEASQGLLNIPLMSCRPSAAVKVGSQSEFSWPEYSGHIRAPLMTYALDIQLASCYRGGLESLDHEVKGKGWSEGGGSDWNCLYLHSHISSSNRSHQDTPSCAPQKRPGKFRGSQTRIRS